VFPSIRTAVDSVVDVSAFPLVSPAKRPGLDALVNMIFNDVYCAKRAEFSA